MANFTPLGVEAVVKGLGQFTSDLGKMDKSIQDAGARTDTLGTKFVAAANSLLKFGAIAATGAAVGLSALAGGLLALSLKTAATADALVEMSDKTGISVERLQELKFIGDQTGTQLETVTGSLARMTRNMAGAVDGTGASADAFKALGVSVIDANGNLRNSQTVFGEVLNALGALDNETQRDALAMQIFGRSAQELNPLIKIGADGMAQMAEQARGLGAVMSESSARAAADFNDKLGALKMGLAGIGMQIGAAVIPLLSQLVDQVIVPAIPTIQAFALSISQFLTTLASSIDWNAITTGISNFIASLQPAIDFLVNNWQPVVAGLVTVILAVVIPALVAWAAAAITAAASTVAALAPVVVPILAIGAAVGLLVAAWKNDWGGIRTTLTAVWENNIAPILEQLRAWLAVSVPAAIEILSGFWNNTLLPAITAVWKFFTDKILPVFQMVIDIAVELGRIIGEVLAFVWTDVLLPAITKIFHYFDENILPILKAVKDFIVNEIGPKVVWFTDNVIKPLASAIGQGLVSAINTVLGWLQKLKDFLSSIHIPSGFKPGSPSPFELSLLGIASAARTLTGEIGALGKALDKIKNEKIFDIGGAFGALGGAASARFQKQTVDPLKARIDEIMAQQKAIQDTIDKQGFADIGQMNELNRLEAERIALAEQYAAAQKKVLDLQKQQEDLAFLKQQMDFLKMIKENNLDITSILGGLQLGLDVSLPDLIQAMSKAIAAMVQKAQEELGAHSPSTVFANIGRSIMQGLAGGMQSTLGAPLGALQTGLTALTAAPRMSAPSIMKSVNVQFGDTHISDGMDQAMFEAAVQRAIVGAF